MCSYCRMVQVKWTDTRSPLCMVEHLTYCSEHLLIYLNLAILNLLLKMSLFHSATKRVNKEENTCNNFKLICALCCAETCFMCKMDEFTAAYNKW